MLSCFALTQPTGLRQNTPYNTQHVCTIKYFLTLCNKHAPQVTKVSYVMGKEQALLLMRKKEFAS